MSEQSLNILITNFTQGAQCHGPSYRTHYMATEWANMGHNVRVLGTTYSHHMWNPPSDVKGHIFIEENGVQYCLMKSPVYSPYGLDRVKAILHIMSAGPQFIRQQCEAFSPDVIISATTYQLDNEGGKKCADAHKAVWIREVRDLWPLSMKYYSKSWWFNPLYLLIRRSERLACDHADLIMSTLSNSFSHFEARGLDKNRFLYVQQVCRPNRNVQSLDEPIFSQLMELKSKHRSVLIFAGGLVRAAYPIEIIRAMSLAESSCHLAVFGSGPLEDECRRLAAELNAPVTFFGSVPQSALSSAFSLVDAGLVFADDCPLYKHGISPNKLTDYLFHGLPCLVSVPGESSIVGLSGGGMYCEGDIHSYAKLIDTFVNLNQDTKASMGQKGKEYVQSNCTPRSICEQVEKKIHELLKTKKRA